MNPFFTPATHPQDALSHESHRWLARAQCVAAQMLRDPKINDAIGGGLGVVLVVLYAIHVGAL